MSKLLRRLGFFLCCAVTVLLALAGSFGLLLALVFGSSVAFFIEPSVYSLGAAIFLGVMIRNAVADARDEADGD